MLLGVTDQNVTHLGWLDEAPGDDAAEAEPLTIETTAAEEASALDEADDLPDDYPGSALRDAVAAPGPLASTNDLLRFQQSLRDAVEARAPSPRVAAAVRARPSASPRRANAASILAESTEDAVATRSERAQPTRSVPSLRRKRKRRASAAPAPNNDFAARSSAPPAVATAALEGQVAGLGALLSRSARR
jgi:hypothetical protein